MDRVSEIKEILHLIAKQVHATDDLKRLCLVSKAWCDQTRPVLFKNLTIRLDQHSVEKLTQHVTIAIHRQASWVQDLYISMADVSNGEEHGQAFLSCLPVLPNLKRLYLDYSNDDELMKAALMPLKTAAKLRDLTLSPTAWYSLKMQPSTLTRLCLLDLPRDSEDEVVIPAHVLKSISQLLDFRIDLAAFEDHADLTGLPQLNHLTLHRPRRIGYATGMCKHLETLEMEDCDEAQVMEVVSTCSYIQTLKIILKEPCIMSRALISSFYPTASELRNLWVESRGRSRQDSTSFLKVDPEDWYCFMAACHRLQVLSIEHPFAIQVRRAEDGYLTMVDSPWPPGHHLVHVLGLTKSSLRRLILLERSDYDIIASSNAFRVEEEMYEIGHSRSRTTTAGKTFALEVWTTDFLYTVDTSSSVNVKLCKKLGRKDFAGEDLSWTEGV